MLSTIRNQDQLMYDLSGECKKLGQNKPLQQINENKFIAVFTGKLIMSQKIRI